MIDTYYMEVVQKAKFHAESFEDAVDVAKKGDVVIEADDISRHTVTDYDPDEMVTVDVTELETISVPRSVAILIAQQCQEEVTDRTADLLD